MVAQVNAEGFFTERPAVGTRVRLEGCPGAWLISARDKAGIVIASRSSSRVSVQFDNGVEDYGEWKYLKPETPAADAPAPEITLNGHRYVLADLPAPEVKREPKQGEIWRYDMKPKPNFWLILQDNKMFCINARNYGVQDSMDTPSSYSFAYPSLAAAIEAGEKFT